MKKQPTSDNSDDKQITIEKIAGGIGAGTVVTLLGTAAVPVAVATVAGYGAVKAAEHVYKQNPKVRRVVDDAAVSVRCTVDDAVCKAKKFIRGIIN